MGFQHAPLVEKSLPVRSSRRRPNWVDSLLTNKAIRPHHLDPVAVAKAFLPANGVK